MADAADIAVVGGNVVMKKKRRLTVVVLGVFLVMLALLACYVLYILTIAGEFKDIEPHFDGSCRAIPGVVGPEDLVILADGSGAFISSDDRRAHLVGEGKPGAIYYYDLTRPGAAPVNLTPDAPPTFHPHGIGLYEGESRTLFVVNHPRGDVQGDIPGEGPAHTIEVYDIVGTRLKHRRSVVDESLLITPNDVAPVGSDQFYVTNDHGSGDKSVRKFEEYLRMAESHLLFFDGSDFRRLPGEYRYANGVIASRDGKHIYLAAATDRTVYVFDRDTKTNTLSLAEEVFVDTAVDNINIDSAGDLWIGAHPKMLTFVSHVADANILSPSQVLRLRSDSAGSYAIEEVMLSDGTDISASTSAARHGNRLLVGSVFASGFLDCEMSASP